MDDSSEENTGRTVDDCLDSLLAADSRIDELQHFCQIWLEQIENARDAAKCWREIATKLFLEVV